MTNQDNDGLTLDEAERVRQVAVRFATVRTVGDGELEDEYFSLFEEEPGGYVVDAIRRLVEES